MEGNDEGLEDIRGAKTKGKKSSLLQSEDSPPQLSIKLPKTSELPKTSGEWSDAELPTDVLLLTAEDCEFLSSFYYLDKPFRSWHKEIGYVYFGSTGSGDQKKLKIALVKCSKWSPQPVVSSIAVKNAVKVLRPKAVFSVGTCSGLSPNKVKLGDVIISSKLTTPSGFTIPVSRNIGHLIRHIVDGWVAPLKNPDEREVRVHRGGDILSQRLATRSGWSHEDVVQHYPEAIAIASEGEGLLTAAFDGQIEWLIVKGLTDYADGDEFTAESWRPFASVMAASVVSHILSDPTVFRSWPHFGVKIGQPDDDELEELSNAIGDKWKKLARRLRFEEVKLTVFDKENEEFAQKAYNMLMNWKQREGSAGTYQALYDALCHPYVGCKDLAEQFCVADVRVLDSIPTYVRARGSKALAAYRKALGEGGSTYDTRVKISLIGQDRVGKTSLGKSLRGELFDKFERSTNGVQMFSFVMNAGTEAWKNPDHLQDATVFDQKVLEEATKELRKAEYQPMAKHLSDEHEELEQVQDETEEASSEGSDNVYKMTAEPRGVALIINNKTFNPLLALETREGSEKDVAELDQLFKSLKFEVQIKQNLGKKQLFSTLKEVANANHSEHDCFVLCLMSHGKKGGHILCSGGGSIHIDEVLEMYNSVNCKTLEGKPKVVFVQACRGNKEDAVEDEPKRKRFKQFTEPPATAICSDAQFDERAHRNADFLIANSTVDDYVSYRRPSQGSYFVLSLVKVFHEKRQDEHLLELMTSVIKDISQLTMEPRKDVKAKAICEFKSSLTKKLFF